MLESPPIMRSFHVWPNIPSNSASHAEEAVPVISLSTAQAAATHAPEVLNSGQHSLQRGQFSRYAVNIVERLQNAGYQAYLVGGCVRDMMLNITPKDFDVATSATPEQVRAEFRNARIIGRRFKLVHIHFGREIIEVATFRANHPQDDEEEDSNQSSRNESGRILRDNVYGTLEEDAQRRDFTINALYYDPVTERVLDYANGVHDIRNRLIRLIGDPEQRYKEDPGAHAACRAFRRQAGFRH